MFLKGVKLGLDRLVVAAAWLAAVAVVCVGCVKKTDLSPEVPSGGGDEPTIGVPIEFSSTLVQTRGEAYGYTLPSPGFVTMWYDEVGGTQGVSFKCEVKSSGTAITPYNKVFFWEDFAEYETLRFYSCYPILGNCITYDAGTLNVRQPADVVDQFDFMTTRKVESIVAEQRVVRLMYEHKMALLKFGVAYVSAKPLTENVYITKVTLSSVRHRDGVWSDRGEFVWGDDFVGEPYDSYAAGFIDSKSGDYALKEEPVQAYVPLIDSDYSKSYSEVLKANHVMFVAPQTLGTITIDYKIGDVQQTPQSLDLGAITAGEGDQIMLYIKFSIDGTTENNVEDEEWHMDPIQNR